MTESSQSPNATAPLPPPPDQTAIAALPARDLLLRYAAGTRHFHRSLLDVPDDLLDTFFREDAGVGRWSCRVVMGHLADSELMLTTRMRMIVGMDRPIIPAFDEDAYIDNHLYAGEQGGADKPVAGFLALIHTLRTFTAEWLGTLDDHHWQRTGLHPQDGEVSLHAVVAKATWHLEHHARFLSLKLAYFDNARAQPASN